MRLPMMALLALAMTGFICIITETLPAGLLPQMAAGLGISSSLAGQFVSAYALGSLLTAIPLSIATQSWRRRTVLLFTIVGFLVFNSVTALSTQYWLTLIARFFAGMAAGLAWSLLAGYARRLVPAPLQGKAMAVAMVGTPIALSLGVPIGTWFGAQIGWRMSFIAMSALTLILIGWVLAKVPDYPGQARGEGIPFGRVLRTPGVRSVLAVVMLWMLAHNLLYTYVSPFIAQAGLADQVDTVLFVFGVAALVAIGIVGHLVDQHLRATVMACLAVFTLVSLAFCWLATVPVVIYIGVALWGLTFGGAATLLQTALADNAGSGADVALSMNVVAWNGAIAGGGLLGGVLLDTWGASSFAPVLVVVLTAGFVIAWMARTTGFKAGSRHPHSV
ncbi:MFS transporter [Gallaecimonas mangrovi]|uniref:MFS transporter n=1 Tax=Gallaecimonas mangrovi TaxID=2291597 RepID=UPI000E202830